jgi:DNA-binding MarR family transcriptional regulator
MVTDDPAKSALIGEVSAEFDELRQAADRLDEAVAAQFDLNRTDLRCLGIIYRRGRVTAGELAEASGLTPGAITTVLDRMERGGYANRVADPSDRRRVLVVSTAATREVGARVYGEVEVAGSGALEERSVDELTVILDYLRRLRDVYVSQAAHVAGQGDDAGAGIGASSVVPTGEPEVWAPLGAVTAGQLRFTKGAARVDIRGDAAPGELYRARFEGPAPDVSVHGGAVTIQQRRRFRPFDWRGQSSEVSLNPAVPWSVSLRGGMWSLTADLRPLRIESLEVGGGASDVEVWLPEPTGVVPVRISGGASKVTLHRPAAAALRALVSGGASQIVFDDQRLGGVGGNNVLSTPGFDTAVDRYEVRFSGGASQVTVDVA